jgi:hypothetical protein
MSPDPTYAEKIAALVSWYLIPENDNRSITPLLQVITRTGIMEGVTSTESSQPGPSDEEIAVKTLLHTLHWHLSFKKISNHDTSFALLEGFTTNERWRECLTTREDAYALAELVISLTEAFLDVKQSLYKTPVWRRKTNQALRSLLDAWIAPDRLPSRQITLGVVAESLFGPVWTQLVMITMNPTDSPAHKIVRAHQPPFLLGRRPGLLLSCAEAIALPSLGDYAP